MQFVRGTKTWHMLDEVCSCKCPTNIATGDLSAQWPFDIWTGRDASAHATAVPVGTFADDSYMFIYASLNAALKELVRFANVFERTRNCGSRS